MTLPNAHQAIVDREKVVGYLLNAAHPDNGGKAAFFDTLGFTRLDWQAFAKAMRQVAVTGAVSKEVPSVHGTKYVVDGQVEGPEGATALARTIWIIDRGFDVPRS